MFSQGAYNDDDDDGDGDGDLDELIFMDEAE